MFQWYLDTVSSGVKINYTCTVYQQFIPKLQPLIKKILSRSVNSAFLNEGHI